MGAKVLAALKSTLDVRPGERLIAGLMFAYLFLVVASFAVVKPVRSSLFLEYFGARNLPYIYLATAVLAGGTAWIHTKLLDRFSLLTVQIGTFLFFIVNLVIFRFAFRSESPWVSAAFFLWVNIYTVTVNTLFWMFANHYYNPREAKRLYGLINAGGTLGGVASGFALSAVVRDVGTENMLLVSAGFLGVCIVLAYWIWRLGRTRFAADESFYVRPPEKASDAAAIDANPLRALLQSRYARLIAGALGLSLVISTLIDYQFNVVVEQAFPGKDQRTALFSGLLAGVNALSFILQFFVTGQLLRRLGIGVAVLLLPVILFGGSVWMALWPGLGAMLFLKIADGSVRYSIEQSSRDVLYLPIPNRLMKKLKTIVDVFVQRLAKGTGSLLILALTVWWMAGLRALVLVSLVLAVAWLATGLLLRTEYRRQLRTFLERENLPDEKKAVGLLDSTTSQELLRALQSRDEATVLYAMGMLAGSRNPEFEPALRRLVHEGTPHLQAMALHLLAELGDRTLVPKAEQLLTAADVVVQEEAIHYLCATSPEGPQSRFQHFLAEPEPRLRAAALACLANCGGAQGESMTAEQFRQMLAETGKKSLASRRVVALALRHIQPPSGLHSFLEPLLRDAAEEVVREALVAASHIRRRDFVPLVIQQLRPGRLREQALETLRAYGSGVLGTLRDYLQDRALQPDSRRLLPLLFVEAGTRNAANDLVASLAAVEPELRPDVIRALNKLKAKQPALQLDREVLGGILDEELRGAYHLLRAKYELTLPDRSSNRAEESMKVLHSLARQHETAVETIFRLLGLLFEQREMYTAYRGLNSQRPELKANALELLETAVPSRWAQFVVPLVDENVAMRDRLQALSMLDPALIGKPTASSVSVKPHAN